MRTATMKLPQDSLFFPGWLATAIGGHILVLLLLFFLFANNAIQVAPNVGRDELPALPTAIPTPDPGTLLPVTLRGWGAWAIDGAMINQAALPRYFEQSLNARRSGVLIIPHKRAPWGVLKRGLEVAIAAGALRIEIQVRTADGGIGSIPLDIHQPLPELPDTAHVQQLVESLAAQAK